MTRWRGRDGLKGVEVAEREQSPARAACSRAERLGALSSALVVKCPHTNVECVRCFATAADFVFVSIFSRAHPVVRVSFTVSLGLSMPWRVLKMQSRVSLR